MNVEVCTWAARPLHPCPLRPACTDISSWCCSGYNTLYTTKAARVACPASVAGSVSLKEYQSVWGQDLESVEGRSGKVLLGDLLDAARSLLQDGVLPGRIQLRSGAQ